MPSTLNHQMKEKKRKREFGQKEKTMKWIRCCVIGVFGSSRMYSCVKHEKQESVWMRREWLWKSGRQGEKSGRKRGEKGEKGKSGFGKSPFVFCWLCLCHFPFFPCTHQPTTCPHPHSPTTHHGAFVHTITCKQGCVLCCLFWEWTARHTASSTPLTPSLDITQHINKPNTDTSHGVNNKEITMVNEGDWTKGKSGTTQQHWTVADHWGMGWCGWHWQWQSVWHQAITHSHPHHPTTKPPPFHPSSLSNSNPLPSAHSTTPSTPLFSTLCCMPHCHNHISFFSQSNFVGFCQWTCWQCASHTFSKDRGGDYRTMASC